MRRLAGRTVVVTGGSRGQGAAEARRFVYEGAHVTIADVLETEGKQLALELGPSARFVKLDVSQPNDWAAAVEPLAGWPPIRVLVNNAAIHWVRSIEEEDPAEILRMWAINQLGPLLGIRSVAPAMRAAGGGSIINVSSVAGLTGLPGHAAYGASKWALRGITRTAAVELGPDSIRVNCIHPGPVDTPMMRPPGSDPDHVPQFPHLPLQRSAQPEEIADLVFFLASDESAYITGAEIPVDGGMLAGPRATPRTATAAPSEPTHG